MMKMPLLLAALVCTALSPLAAAPPKLPIDQALKLAMDHLAERGLAGQHYIESLSLEDTALVGGTKFWFARWVPSIPVEQKSEYGLRINLDGSLIRLTSGGRANAQKRATWGARTIH